MKIWAKMSHWTPKSTVPRLAATWVVHRQEPADEYHRQPFETDHHDDQQLLQALIEHLVAWVVSVQSQQVRTAEQLENDARGDDRSDTEVQDSSSSTAEDRTEVTEDIGTLVCPVQEDVCQEEVQQ